MEQRQTQYSETMYGIQKEIEFHLSKWEYLLHIHVFVDLKESILVLNLLSWYGVSIIAIHLYRRVFRVKNTLWVSHNLRYMCVLDMLVLDPNYHNVGIENV